MANTPTTPTTVVTGTAGTAAWANAQVRDNFDYTLTSAPAVRAFNSADISITTSGTAQALTFDSERYDAGSGMHSTVTNTGRLTAPTGCGGKYLIGAHVAFASNATGYRQVQIRLNGTTVIAENSTPAISGLPTRISVTTEYALAAADYVEVVVTQTSGGALAVSATGNVSPEFWATWVRT